MTVTPNSDKIDVSVIVWLTLVGTNKVSRFGKTLFVDKKDQVLQAAIDIVTKMGGLVYETSKLDIENMEEDYIIRC